MTHYTHVLHVQETLHSLDLPIILAKENTGVILSQQDINAITKFCCDAGSVGGDIRTEIWTKNKYLEEAFKTAQANNQPLIQVLMPAFHEAVRQRQAQEQQEYKEWSMQ